MTNQPQKFRKVRTKFQDVILKNFGADVLFSTFAGTFAYNSRNPHSDIDVLVVLDNPTPSAQLTERRRKFTEQYRRLHSELGFQPDHFFPGEVISRHMLEDAIAGRGYDLDEFGKVKLEHIETNAQWLINSREYRCWHSMMAFNNERLITGNRVLFDKYRRKAIKELAKFLCHDLAPGETDSIDALSSRIVTGIVEAGSSYLGINGRYSPNFEIDCQASMTSALYELHHEEYIHKTHSVAPNPEKVKEFIRDLAERLKEKRFKSQPLFDWAEIR